MNDTFRKDIIFTTEELNDIFRILDYSSFFIIDVRHHLISPKEAIYDYRLPCNAFLFTNGTKAEILLGEKSYLINHFSLFHGIKGNQLSIMPYSDWLEYYMVFYKTGETPFNKEQLKKLLKHINPYEKQYGFSPQNPVLFTETLRSMYEHWLHPDPMKKFYVKTLFYQFTHELFQELTLDHILTFDCDIAKMAIRYIENNYGSSITVQDICQRFGISYSHFNRLIKKETGSSFQRYLLNVRLEKARKYILESNFSLSEIAKFTGFYDEFHLSSSFKKFTGKSPTSLRKNLTWNKEYAYMDISNTSLYNEPCLVSYDEPTLEGAYSMLKKFKIKTPVIAAAFLLMAILSACSSPAKTNSSDSTKAQNESTNGTLTSETRIFSTQKGDIEIPVNPKRLVTDSRILGDVLALGVTPVAIEDYGSKDVSYKDLIKDTKVLEKWEPEYIMAEKPDLIITMDEENYETLSKIAPTIYVPIVGHTAEERLSLISEALGKDSAEGKKVLDTYNEKVANYKEKLKEAGLYDKTFSVIRVQGPNEIGVRWSNNLGGQILFGSLELPQTEAALEEVKLGVDWGATLSFEALPKYMGDYILVTESDNYDMIKDNPVWNSLPAVQKGNIIILSEPYMYLNDIYSWSAQLDLVANSLLELTNGENK
jgi:iron complex transport system substrate-binding protein